MTAKVTCVSLADYDYFNVVGRSALDELKQTITKEF